MCDRTSWTGRIRRSSATSKNSLCSRRSALGGSHWRNFGTAPGWLWGLCRRKVNYRWLY